MNFLLLLLLLWALFASSPVDSITKKKWTISLLFFTFILLFISINHLLWSLNSNLYLIVKFKFTVPLGYVIQDNSKWPCQARISKYTQIIFFFFTFQNVCLYSYNQDKAAKVKNASIVLLVLVSRICLFFLFY